MGNASRRKGDREAAVRSYEKALELDPNNAGAKRALTQLKSEQ
jgi:cytochrome c-type biogenesis protein CcmH/NrfG